jgi:hypothetical protein
MFINPPLLIFKSQHPLLRTINRKVVEALHLGTNVAHNSDFKIQFGHYHTPAFAWSVAATDESLRHCHVIDFRSTS